MIQNNFLKLIVFEYNSEREVYDVKVALEKPIYIEYSRKYSEKDSSKLVFVLSSQNSEFLKKGNIIWIEDDICMCIESIKFTSENTISVWGSLCDSLLSRRVVFEDLTFEDTPIEDVFDELFQSIDEFPGVTLARRNLPEDANYTGTISAGNFLDIVINLCKKFELGFHMYKTSSTLDDLEFTFEVYYGQDKSENVIMSQRFNSISDFEYTLTSDDEINFVRVVGDSDLYADVELPSLNEFEKHEAIITSNEERGEKTDEEYQAELVKEGQKYLSEHMERETFSGTYTGEAFVFDQDFTIGDIVAIQDTERSFDTTRRVSEYRKQIDSSGIYQHITFGDFQKTIKDVINSISTKTTKVVQSEVKEGSFNWITSVTAPPFLTAGDFLVKTASGDLTTVTGLQILQNNAWTNVQGYLWGSTYPSNPSSYDGKYFVFVTAGQPRVVLKSENNSWMAKAYQSPDTQAANVFFLNNIPTDVAHNGDMWIKINNTTDRQATEAYKAISNAWVSQFKFGGGTIVNIEHALVYRKGQQQS